jgi:hypothetical protein
MTFEGTLSIDEQGKAKVLEQAMLQQFYINNKGVKCAILIKPIKRKSDPLRRYYFGVVVEMLRTEFRKLGHALTKEECHEFVKQFSPSMSSEIVMPSGEVLTRYVSIADPSFSNTQFMEYIEDLRQWAGENLDLIIPDPNDFT